MRRAYKQVKKNKGIAGVDQMPVWDFAIWCMQEGETLIGKLKPGTHQPQDVRHAEISKSGGGIRKLGIPKVIDRVIQRAIAQVLSPICGMKFSDHSYGFRPNRNVHQALKKASGYVEEGREIEVDIDLKTFFEELITTV